MHHIVVFDYEAMLKAIFNNAEQPAPAPARQRKQQRKQQRLTIYDIKRLLDPSQQSFFDRETMKFFHQTLKDFRVYKLTEQVYFITAPVVINGRKVGDTERYYNTVTHMLTVENPLQ